MDKMYTLVGEDFFREMMRSKDERRRRLAGGNQWGGAGGGGNVVSLQDYRRRQTERVITPFVPPKSSA